MKISKHRSGLTVGSVWTLLHLGWIVLVYATQAERVTNWLLQLHFLNDPSMMYAPFHPFTALLLLVYAFVAGYVVGWLVAFFWNRFGS